MIEKDLDKNYNKQKFIKNISFTLLDKEAKSKGIKRWQVDLITVEQCLQEARKEYNNLSDEAKENIEECFDHNRYEVPEENCPICTLKHISDADMLNYMLNKYNLERTRVEDIIRSKFNSYVDLKKFLRGEKHES